MNKKQLAEMIKALRKKKMEEQGSIKHQSKDYLENQKFEPIHSPDTYSPKGGTPNDYAHRMQEARVPIIGGGLQGKSTLGNLSKRVIGQKNRSNQNTRRRYLNRPMSEEDTKKLGATDTKKKTQSVTITPEIEQFGKQ
jgi:hypothetical protein